MKAGGKITQEALTRESRFVLQCVASLAEPGKGVALEMVERQIGKEVSLELSHFVTFLTHYRYLKQDKEREDISLTSDGQRVLTGEYAPILASVVVHHFRPLLAGKPMPLPRPPRPPRSPKAEPEPPVEAAEPELPPEEETAPDPVEDVATLPRGDEPTVLGHESAGWPGAEALAPEPALGEVATELGPGTWPSGEDGLGDLDDPETWINQVPQDDAAAAQGQNLDIASITGMDTDFSNQLEEAEHESVTGMLPSLASLNEQEQEQVEGLEDGRYLRLRELGGGAVGTVFLARQINLARDVAVKEFGAHLNGLTAHRREQVLRCFLDVVETEARLAHPNLVKLLDANTLRENPYVVSEYLPGGSLRQLLRGNTSLSPLLAFKVAFHVLHALRYVHDCGLLHAGIKPENILFDAGGNVRLSDLGMGEIILYDHPDLRQVLLPPTQACYLAPEAVVDPNALAPACDLFSLGVVFYEMLTGVVPGPTAPLPSEVQPDLPELADDLFVRLTRPEAADRYLSADDALEDIYRTDALHWFMDPRDALFFLGSVAGVEAMEQGETFRPIPEDMQDAGEAPVIDPYATIGYGEPVNRPVYQDDYYPDDLPLSSTPTWEWPAAVADDADDGDEL